MKRIVQAVLYLLIALCPTAVAASPPESFDLLNALILRLFL